MAKDGSSRGGPRTGSGRKSKALLEKAAEGNPGGRQLKIIDLPDAPSLEGVDVPEPSEYLKTKQKAIGVYDPVSIYRKTWVWLRQCGCEQLISQQLIEQYAPVGAVSRVSFGYRASPVLRRCDSRSPDDWAAG